MPALVDLLKQNLRDEKWTAYLRNLEKFGNDDAKVDGYTIYVADAFSKIINGHRNTRGGRYTTGLYSVTAHQYFGEITGALPNGRRKGEALASGISPANGQDRNGPTAMLNSINRIDFKKFANGINLNVKFAFDTVKGKVGRRALQNVFRTYFRRGGMQVQLNILDPAVLREARDNPDAHPGLLVRVSGYSAYFNDLTPGMKDEIILRSCIQAQ